MGVKGVTWGIIFLSILYMLTCFFKTLQIFLKPLCIIDHLSIDTHVFYSVYRAFTGLMATVGRETCPESLLLHQI